MPNEEAGKARNTVPELECLVSSLQSMGNIYPEKLEDGVLILSCSFFPESKADSRHRAGHRLRGA